MPAKPKSNKILAITLIITIFLIGLQFLSTVIKPCYYLNFSVSEPRGLYRTTSFNGRLQYGELVLLEVPSQARPYVHGRDWLPKGWLLLKNVGALPGDSFSITDTVLFINNKYVGPVSEKDSRGMPLPRLRGRFRVREGYFLPISTNIPNSFDGRYFGQVPFRLIRAKAVPVITF